MALIRNARWEKERMETRVDAPLRSINIAARLGWSQDEPAQPCLEQIKQFCSEINLLMVNVSCMEPERKRQLAVGESGGQRTAGVAAAENTEGRAWR